MVPLVRSNSLGPQLEANFDQPSKIRKDFLFRRQFNEKPHLGFMPGCPDMLIIAL